MIEGVIIRKLTQFKDERGWLAEFWRGDESDYRPMMGYVSLTLPGVVRGPHEHKEQSDCFIFAGPGNFTLHLWENRENKSNYREVKTFEVGESNPVAVIVPPGVVHGYKCISDVPAYSFNLADRLYKGEGKHQEVDEIRWEKDPESPFKIS